MKKRDRGTLIVLFICFAVFLAVGVFFCVNSAKYVREGEKTEAVITEITTYTDSDGDTQHRVYVSFTVEGKNYSGRLNTYSSSMHEGKIVPVIYLKDNPRDFIYAKNLFLIPVLLIFMGGICLSFIIVLLTKSVFNGNRLSVLKRNGILVSATVSDVDFNDNVRVLDKRPLKLSCLDSRGNVYDGSFLDEGNAVFAVGDPINVYVSRKNPKKYAIDIEEYTERKAVPVSDFEEYEG